METLKKKKTGTKFLLRTVLKCTSVSITKDNWGWEVKIQDRIRAYMSIYKSIYKSKYRVYYPHCSASSFHTPSPSLPNPASSLYNQQSQHPPHIILGGKMIVDSQGIIVRVISKSFGSLNNFKIFWFCAPHVLGSFLAQTRELDYLTMFDLVETVMISVSAAILTDQYCQ